MDPFASPSSIARARAALQAGEIRNAFAEPKLRALLDDASPFVVAHGTRKVISEVRFTALEALELVCHRHKKELALGPVTVRRAMPVDEALTRAIALADEDRKRVHDLVETALREKVAPAEADELAIRAYLTLQALGAIEYRRELVDPATFMTPLQDDVRRTQTASERPRPHLRVADLADATRTFGFVYRGADQKWALDFADGVGAADAVETLKAVMRPSLQRARVDERGETIRNPDGTAQFEGTLLLAGPDTLAVLQTLRVYLERRFACTIAT